MSNKSYSLFIVLHRKVVRKKPGCGRILRLTGNRPYAPAAVHNTEKHLYNYNLCRLDVALLKMHVVMSHLS